MTTETTKREPRILRSESAYEADLRKQAEFQASTRTEKSRRQQLGEALVKAIKTDFMTVVDLNGFAQWDFMKQRCWEAYQRAFVSIPDYLRKLNEENARLIKFEKPGEVTNNKLAFNNQRIAQGREAEFYWATRYEAAQRVYTWLLANLCSQDDAVGLWFNKKVGIKRWEPYAKAPVKDVTAQSDARAQAVANARAMGIEVDVEIQQPKAAPKKRTKKAKKPAAAPTAAEPNDPIADILPA